MRDALHASHADQRREQDVEPIRARSNAAASAGSIGYKLRISPTWMRAYSFLNSRATRKDSLKAKNRPQTAVAQLFTIELLLGGRQGHRDIPTTV